MQNFYKETKSFENLKIKKKYIFNNKKFLVKFNATKNFYE